MSNGICKTVRIKSTDTKSQGNFVEINEDDFDEKKHTLFIPEAPSARPPANVPAPSAQVRKMVEENGLLLSNIEGTGAKGKITVKDVEDAIEATALASINFESDEAGELFAETSLTIENFEGVGGSGADGALTVDDIEAVIDGLTDDE